MGTGESKEEQPKITHEQIVSIINASNAKSKEHSEKTASSTELIAYIMLTIVIVGLVYIVYKLITKYERMKSQALMNNTISMNNLKTSIV